MRRLWLPALALLLAGCGVQPTDAEDAGEAPTGVAPGPTLYFVDGDGALVADVRELGHLGTVDDAVSLLLKGPGGSSLGTQIEDGDMTSVEVAEADGVIYLRVPLAIYEVTATGIDQIVCTALAAHVQSGGEAGAQVRVSFTIDDGESDELRTCPLLD